jgi:uncharacterized protein
MEVAGDGTSQRLTFRTNVDDVVIVGAANPLHFVLEPSSGGLKPYVRVRGRLNALVTRAVYYDLIDLAVSGDDHGPNAQYGLWSSGAWFPLIAGP